MDHKLHLDLVYENNLDTDKIARRFNLNYSRSNL